MTEENRRNNLLPNIAEIKAANGGTGNPKGQKDKKKKANWAWPEITDLRSAEIAAKEGVVAAGFVCAATTAAVVVGYMPQAALVDAIFFFGIGLGIYFKSRTAAVLGLIIYIAEQAYQFSVSPPKSVPWMLIIMSCAFMASVRGTFAYHKYKKGLSPRPPAQSNESKSSAA